MPNTPPKRTSPSSPRALPVIIVLWSGLLVSASSARTVGSFEKHTDHAITLYQQQHYEDSIREFQAAYAIRPWPRLLFNIGQAHLKLGQAKEALSYYEHYLR